MRFPTSLGILALAGLSLAAPAFASWPANDGVPTVAGTSATLLPQAGGGLVVVTQGNCSYYPLSIFSGLGLTRSAFDPSGALATPPESLSCEYTDPLNGGYGWGRPVEDGRGHLFAAYGSYSHGWGSSQLYALKLGWSYSLGTAESYAPYGLKGNGGGRVYQLYANENTTTSVITAYLACFDSAGSAWPKITISTNAHSGTLGVDDAGDAIVAWVERPNIDSTSVQAFSPDGIARWAKPARIPGWVWSIAGDDAGGAYLLTYPPGGAGAPLVRLDHDGTRHAGWPAAGVDAAPGETYPFNLGLVADGAGGALVSDTQTMKLQRIAPEGHVAAGWPAAGLALPIPRSSPAIVPDGTGGAWVVFGRTVGTGDTDLRYGRITPGGATWGDSSGTTWVTAPGQQTLLSGASDGAGGFYAAWDDRRTPSAQRIRVGHVAAPPPAVTVGFPNGGELLFLSSTPLLEWSVSATGPIASIDLDLSRDLGATWEPIAAQLPGDRRSYVWYVTPPLTGDAFGPTYTALLRVTATDDAGRSGSDVSNTGWAIYDYIDAVRPVTEFDASPCDAGVRLHWVVASGVTLEHVVVERSDAEAGPWLALAAAPIENDGAFVAIDRTATAGRPYWYRLTGTTGGETHVIGPVRAAATAPRAFALAIESANPARGRVALALDVPRDVRLAVEVLDLQGRRVATLANGGFAAGRHRVEWDGRGANGQAPAGLYFVRATGSARTLIRRIVLER